MCAKGAIEGGLDRLAHLEQVVNEIHKRTVAWEGSPAQYLTLQQAFDRIAKLASELKMRFVDVPAVPEHTVLRHDPAFGPERRPVCPRCLQELKT